MATEHGERLWFVSYDVTERNIVLHHAGDDPVNITSDEAMALHNELLAAVICGERTDAMATVRRVLFRLRNVHTDTDCWCVPRRYR
jgi:hypothetical protein